MTESVDSPSTYELKANLPPVSEFNEAETETKVDLSNIERSVDGSPADLSVKAEASLPTDLKKVSLQEQDEAKLKEMDPDKDVLDKSDDVNVDESKNSDTNVIENPSASELYKEEKSHIIVDSAEERVGGDSVVIENLTTTKGSPELGEGEDTKDKEATEEEKSLNIADSADERVGGDSVVIENLTTAEGSPKLGEGEGGDTKDEEVAEESIL